MDPIITLSSGCVLNAITRTKLMTGLKRKLQSAKITYVYIQVQMFKFSLKDTKKQERVTVKNVNLNTTPQAQQTSVDLVCGKLPSAAANTVAASVKVMRIPSVRSALN